MNGNGNAKNGNGKLNPKQEAFARELVIDFNVTKAAIRAGYAKTGAHVQGHHLLQNPKVIAKYRELVEARNKRCDFDADRAMLEVKRIALSDIRDAVAWHPDRGVVFMDSDSLTPDIAACVKKVKSKTVYKSVKDDDNLIEVQLEIEFYDKVKALDQAHKLMGAYNETIWLGDEKDKPQPGVMLGERKPLKLLKDGTDG